MDLVQRLHSEVLHSEMEIAQVVRNDDVWAARVEAVAAFYHPDVESVRLGLPDGRTYYGLDGLRNLWLEWLAPWTTYRIEAEDVITSEIGFLFSPTFSDALRGAKRRWKTSSRLSGHSAMGKSLAPSLRRSRRSPQSRGAHMNERLSRSSVDPRGTRLCVRHGGGGDSRGATS